MEPFKTIILPLIENGIFGEVEFESLLPDDTEIGPQFASSLAFLNLTVRGSSGSQLFPLVVKLPFAEPELRKKRNTSGMFFNEVTMYKEVLPVLGFDRSAYPKIHHGVASGVPDCDSDVLILENLKHKGFEISRVKVLLDISHVALAIKKIAEFHSLSYKMKYENGSGFFKLTQKVKYLTLPETTKHESNRTNAAGVKRGMKRLLNGNKDGDIVGKCLKLMENPFNVREMLGSPEEPFAVICHGDFCNSNVLYKYDKSGAPIDCALFDFQLSRYASPAIDLFFFLYMHTTSDFREKYWDEVLKMYWDSLRNSIPGHIDIPDFQQYLDHFSKRAIYGYTISSWYLPMLIEENPLPLDDYLKLTLEKKIHYFLTVGGDEGEKIISEIVSHMLQKGYIKEFVQFCKEKAYS